MRFTSCSQSNVKALISVVLFPQEKAELRTKLRSSEEEVISLRERVHSATKSCAVTVDQLHNLETQLQRAKGKLTCLGVQIEKYPL